jgi:hypothetical protein
MPLIITVGLNRKRSENYQSDGASISLTAELDPSLLSRPEALQAHIDSLYEQADTALAFRSFPSVPQQHHCPAHASHQPSPSAMVDTAGREDCSKQVGKNIRSNGNGQSVGRMTNSQRRAINVIASAIGVDPHREARALKGVELDQLSVRQASDLIDHLKAQSRP